MFNGKTHSSSIPTRVLILPAKYSDALRLLAFPALFLATQV